MTKQRRSVIFDVDGVLVDSYHAHFHSWLALADECGCHRMTEEEFRATFGRTTRESIQQLWDDATLTAQDIAALDDRKEVLFREMLQADFRPLPGASDLIKALSAAGFGLAAGSSGPPDNVCLVLDRLGCRHYFDAVVTGVDVERGKPDPEVFLTCARRIAAVPIDCAVIEDAVVGVQAAKRAGMFAIALVVAGRDRRLFGQADQIVGELRELSPDGIRRSLAARS